MSAKRSSRIYDFNHTYQFIQMRGPNLKGFAEMAVTKAKDHEAVDHPMTPIQLLSKNPKYSPQLKHTGSGGSSTGAVYNPPSASSSNGENANSVPSNGVDQTDGNGDIFTGIPQIDSEQLATSVKSNSLLGNGSRSSSTNGRGSPTTRPRGSLPRSLSDDQEVNGRGPPGLVRASGGVTAWREGSEKVSRGGDSETAAVSQDSPDGEVSQKKGTLKGRLKLHRLSSRK